MLKAAGPTVLTSEAKRVDIVLVDVFPVFKTDTEFECTLYRGEEFSLIDL